MTYQGPAGRMRDEPGTDEGRARDLQDELGTLQYEQYLWAKTRSPGTSVKLEGKNYFQSISFHAMQCHRANVKFCPKLEGGCPLFPRRQQTSGENQAAATETFRGDPKCARKATKKHGNSPSIASLTI